MAGRAPGAGANQNISAVAIEYRIWPQTNERVANEVLIGRAKLWQSVGRPGLVYATGKAHHAWPAASFYLY